MSFSSKIQNIFSSKNNSNDLKSNKMDSNNILLNLFRILIPTFLLMLTTISYIIIDSVLVAKLTNDYYAATGLNFSVGNALIAYALPFINIFASFIYVVVIGTTIVYGNYLGQKKSESEIKTLISNSFSTSVYLAMILAFLVNLVGLFYTNFVISRSGFSIYYQADLIRELRIYILIISFTFLTGVVNQTFLRLLRVEGKANQASIIGVIPIISNPILDWLFMGVANVGIAGSAMASLISTFLVSIVFFTYTSRLIKRKETNLNFKFLGPFKLNNALVKTILVLGVVIISRRIAGSYQQILLVSTITNLPPIYQNNQEIWATFANALFRINTLFIIVGVSIGQSSSQLISYYHGQNNKEKIKKTIYYSLGIILILQIFFLFLIKYFSADLLYIFGIHEIFNDPELKASFTKIIWIILLGSFFELLPIVFIAFYNSAGFKKESFIFTFLTKIIIFTTLILIFFFINKNHVPTDSVFFYYFYLLAGISSFVIIVPYSIYFLKVKYN